MKLAFSIGMRFLKKSKGQTLLIIIGIVIGVAVQVFVGSLIDGLQFSLVDGTIGSQPHITIIDEEASETFTEADDLIEELKEDERLTAVLKSFSRNGFILQDEDETSAVFLRGFEFEEADEIYNLEDALVEGNMPAGENEILIGTDFSEKTGIEVGDAVEFIATANALENLKVVGLFDLGVTSLNESWVISELETAQTIFEEEGQLSTIEMQVADVFTAGEIADEIENTIESDGLITTNWEDENESLLSGLMGQSISSIMIQVFVLIAVLLGIASVLAISGIQKSKQLGILKAMGIKDRTAGQIFLFQGFALGSVGAIVGSAVGIGLMYGFSTFVLNPDGTALVPFYVDPQFVLISVGIAIVASTIAAFIPARNSSKLNPIEVIQNG